MKGWVILVILILVLGAAIVYIATSDYVENDDTSNSAGTQSGAVAGDAQMDKIEDAIDEALADN